MIIIDGDSLTCEQVEAVAFHGGTVELSPEARSRVATSREIVDQIIEEGRIVYGVNTGFGKLATVTIPRQQIRQLQLNLVRSHCCGIGEPLSEAETRAMMLMRAKVLAKGYSGVRPIVIDVLLKMLNAGVHPIIPSKGSVGASGDLAPLAHLALAVIGEGEVIHRGRRVAAGLALNDIDVEPVQLEAKEGLALLNGTQAMTAVGALALLRTMELLDLADIAGAMSLEALHGTVSACDSRIHNARPHPGQSAVAQRLVRLTRDSEILRSHKDCPRVQDAYSLRCMPQVHGAARDVTDHVRRLLEIEINSATDNPLVFPETGDVISGGNFHGEPVALAFDYLAMAVSELGAISERRIERLVNPDLSELPAFLSPTPGVCSGLMVFQIAAVSLCAENKILAHPASVDSLPTDGNKEDHVSMGMTSALKVRQIIENVTMILTLELICAAQGLEFLKPLLPGHGTRQAFEKVRQIVPPLTADRVWSTDIERLRRQLSEFREIL